ncbi:MAG TPA: RDD family protein, partial [Acidimicrobiales bacterium]|nr:RDD family protein [Acidimicrobiales bacterium]
PTLIVFAVAATSTSTSTATATVHHTSGGATALAYLVVTLIQGFYFASLNGSARGQTIGNRAPHIAVRDANSGAPIGFWRAALRWLVRMVLYACLFVPGFLNDLWPLWDSQRQTLADKAARTVMVRV